ncbi:molybdopterin synthase catalytic subunit [Olivibacter sitiensis]|uniref:molybdopterin synthase catalytic subunit n=1 Tax=Olivibacter sitiensis TaxID=376470 RepID=UPI0003FB8800|nr:molybdenum cofactor biosynthesis protein MoaE [Olivibacter sitiensis]
MTDLARLEKFHTEQRMPLFVEEGLPADLILKAVSPPSGNERQTGASSSFLGWVRADYRGNSKVISIIFTAYEDMAKDRIQRLRNELIGKYKVSDIQVVHSLGEVAVGECCFLVAVTAAHRTEAMQACQEMVNKVKAEVPIWGLERFDDEQTQWKRNHE